MQSQTVHQVDENEGPLQVQQESIWECPFSQMNTASDSASCQNEGDLSSHSIQYDEIPGSECLSVKEPESDTSRNKVAGHRVEDAQNLPGGMDVPGIIITHLEQPEEEIDCVHLQEREGQAPELKEEVDADTASASESPACKDDAGPVWSTSLFKSDFTADVKAAAPEDNDRDICSKDFESFHEDPAPLQTQDDQESQLVQQPLPSKTLVDPLAQPEVGLGQTLSSTFAILCAAIGLAVGFQEPSFFLILGLFLVALCF